MGMIRKRRACATSIRSAELRRGVKGLRLGRLSKDQSAGIDPEILSAYDHSVEFLAGLGADIVDLALPIDILDLGTATAKIISAESYAMLARLVDDNAQPLDQDVRPRVRAGAAISSKDYLQLLAQRQQMKIDFAAAIENLDALLTPTLTTPAMPIATIDQAGSPAMFTRWVNFLDLCAVAVPNGFTAGRTAIVAPGRLPSLPGAAGAADRVCLSDRARLAHAGAAAGGLKRGSVADPAEQLNYCAGGCSSGACSTGVSGAAGLVR